MIAALLWGALGGSALLVGAVIAFRANPGHKAIAVIMAVGTGILIGSVAFELVDEAIENADPIAVGILTLIGAGVFTAGNWWLERRGGGDRKDPTGSQGEGRAEAIVLGSVLDGVPESFVLGMSVLQGAVSTPLLVGILLSNLPEGMSSSSGLRIAGWDAGRVYRMWALVMVASALSAAAGYVILDPGLGRTGAMAQAFAAGALLAMLANTMLPEAFEVEGVLTGSLVVAGFAFSIILTAA